MSAARPEPSIVSQFRPAPRSFEAHGAAAGPRAAEPTPIRIPPQSRPVEADPHAALRQLLGVEAEIRRVGTRDALMLLLVNEIRKIGRARQVFAIRIDGRGLAFERVSSLASLDRDAPLIRWLEGLTRRRFEAGELVQPRLLDLAAEPVSQEGAESYPFRFALWTPALDREGGLVGGFLLTREEPFGADEQALSGRIAETGAHALLALEAKPGMRFGWLKSEKFKRNAKIAACIAVAALVIPVPMAALAPAEIIAEKPLVVAAPIDGVIQEIAVAPNAQVQPGDTLVRYVDTAQKSQLDIAERDVGVADARLRQIGQAAFLDDKARRDIGEARAELALKVAERDFARDTFGRTSVKAERAGVAVYADRKEWTGKPVSVGQRILEIADPSRVEVRIDLPVADSIVLKPGAKVRVFLDSDALRPVDAHVTVATPLARPTESNVLAYRIVAALDKGETPPRLGARGTAQVSDGLTPLGFYLFRKPLTWARQKVGL